MNCVGFVFVFVRLLGFCCCVVLFSVVFFFYWTSEQEKLRAEYSFVSCRVMNRLMNRLISIHANVFLQVSKYTALYFVKVLFSSKLKPQ